MTDLFGNQKHYRVHDCSICNGTGRDGEERECRNCNGEGRLYDYTLQKYKTFVAAMQRKNIPVFHYRGRGFYDGPAARTDSDNDIYREDIEKATRLGLTADSLGFDIVLYPA